MKKTLLALSSVALLGLATVAHADSFNIISSNGNSLGCTASAPCATVTLTVNGAGTQASFSVSSLLSGYVFDEFGFNGPAGLTLGATSGEVSGPSLGGSKNLSSWGSFPWVFDTGENGGSHGSDCVVTSGTPGAGCTFTFVVNGTGLTLSEFETSANDDFAGHMASGANSGFAGDTDPTTTPTPEPSSLFLLGTGVLGAAGMLRRKMAGVTR